MAVTSTGQRGRSRLRRVAVWTMSGALVLVVIAELVARLWFGLGDPILYVADEEIEYLVKPGVYHRFGHTVEINQWSMRSGPLTPTRERDEEFRVIVIGDSVVNGGAMIDQSELATTLLQKRLDRALDVPVLVGNVSAGSWGPENMLAYARRFGLFDADVVVILLNSQDHVDVREQPSKVGISPALPDRTPRLALSEAWVRYVWPYCRVHLMHLLGLGDPPERPSVEQVLEMQRRTMGALADLVGMARKSGASVIVAMHVEPAALTRTTSGYWAVAGKSARLGVPFVDLGPRFLENQKLGLAPYHDSFHPSALGHRLIADDLEAAILKERDDRLRDPAGGGSPSR